MEVEGARSLAANVLRLELPKGKSQNVKETAKDQGHNIGGSQTATTPPQESDFVAANIDGLVRSQAASFIKIWLPKLSRPK